MISFLDLVNIDIIGQTNGAEYLRKEFNDFPRPSGKPSQKLLFFFGQQPLQERCKTIVIRGRFKCLPYKVTISGLQNRETHVYFQGNGILGRFFFLKFVIPVIRQKITPFGVTLLKASSLLAGQNAYLFTGKEKSGKTSLFLIGMAQGYLPLADNFSAVDRSGMVYPLPFQLHLFARNMRIFNSSPVIPVTKNRIGDIGRDLVRRASLNRINLSKTLSLGEFRNKQPKKYPLKCLVYLKGDSKRTIFEYKTKVGLSFGNAVTKITERETFEYFDGPLKTSVRFWRETGNLVDNILAQNSISKFILNTGSHTTEEELTSILNILTGSNNDQ